METFLICAPQEARATCWLRRAVFTVLAGVALLALVTSFAVEFVAFTPSSVHAKAP